MEKIKTLIDLKKIRDDYETYKKIVLVKRLKTYFKAHKNYFEMDNKFNKNMEKKVIKEEMFKKAIEKEERLRNELELKSKELKELEGSKDNTLINMLETSINELNRLDSKIDFLDKDIKNQELKLKKEEEINCNLCQGH